MKRRVVGFLPVFLVLLLLPSAQAGAISPEGKSFLWEARSKTATVYLLGSLHLMKKESYPLPEKIEKAFERSDVLAVEANINDPGRIDVMTLMERVFYPEAEGLEDHVSKETYEAVTKEAAALGLPPELLDRQRPWFIALTLTALKLAGLGFDPSYGTDMHFLSKAGGKKIVELESVDAQIRLLSGFSDSEQELFLIRTLNDLKSVEKDTDALLRAWTSGDMRGIERLLSKDGAEGKKMASLNEKLLYSRNREMASRIENLLRAKETAFVIVGAGHLVGEKGIIALLRQKGYSIEQR
jgi:hypothetical protein